MKSNTEILFGAADMIFNFVPEGIGNIQFKNIEKWNQLGSYQKLNELIDLIQKSNLDFIELGATWMNEANPENDPKIIESILINKNIRVHSICSLLPEELNIFSTDNIILQNYFDTLVENLKKIRPAIIVFGSGLARNKPAEISDDIGHKRFAEVLDLIVKILDKHGLVNTTILIENLNINECNFINSSDDAYKVIKLARTDRVGMLFDIFHWYREEVDWKKSFLKHQDLINHIHISDPITRKNPCRDGDGIKIIIEMLKLLATNNYKKSISFECVFNDIEYQLGNSIELLKNHLN